MNKIKLFGIVAIVTMIGLSSCGKYEDGPGISFRSKKGRVEGEWKLSSRTTNGTNETLDADEKDDTYKFTKDGKVEVQDPGNATITGDWVFDSKKENMTITYSAFGFSFAQKVKILELRNNEMKWEYTDGTDKYVEVYTQ